MSKLGTVWWFERRRGKVTGLKKYISRIFYLVDKLFPISAFHIDMQTLEI